MLGPARPVKTGHLNIDEELSRHAVICHVERVHLYQKLGNANEERKENAIAASILICTFQLARINRSPIRCSFSDEIADLYSKSIKLCLHAKAFRTAETSTQNYERPPKRTKTGSEYLDQNENGNRLTGLLRLSTLVSIPTIPTCEAPPQILSAEVRIATTSMKPGSNSGPVFVSTLFGLVAIRTLDEAKPQEEGGFRQGFSCLDYFHTVSRVMEICKEYRFSFVLTFAFYEKAFNSVETNAMLSALVDQGVNVSYVRTLANCYDRCTTTIQLFYRPHHIYWKAGAARRYYIAEAAHGFIAVDNEMCELKGITPRI
ncbi:hypothetical protein RB195_023102 [Necator americanus]|uniref:Reverse transcriptase domain-containing protein n=1 Tax=Necator americanus TaxID=51031 RepID=A0ABR1EHV7_NECAM